MTKGSVVGLVCVWTFVGFLSGLTAFQWKRNSVLASAPTTWSGRGFYLTKAAVQGDKPIGSCSTGYHMANMAEIVNPSVLKYDTGLGYMNPDSGSGPPFDVEGWVRTGNVGIGAALNGGGYANCAVWTTNSPDSGGTVIQLQGVWGTNSDGEGQVNWAPSIVAPWRTRIVPIPGHPHPISRCNETYRVWCVQN
jgi:hypothetical protein